MKVVGHWSTGTILWDEMQPTIILHDDIESIQDHLNSLIKDLSSDWKGSIPFCCHVIYNNDQVHEQILEDPPPMIDICDYLGGLLYPASIELLFSPITYPPPKSNCQMSSTANSETSTGWTALSRPVISLLLHMKLGTP